MKKSIFLMLLTFVIFTNFTIAQDIKPEKNHQTTIDAIEQTVSFYIQQNIDKKIPIDFSAEARATSELNNVKSRNYYIISLKEDFLRKQFFDNNPSLISAYRKTKGTRNVTPCTETNNDGTFENGNPGTYSAKKNGSPISIVTESPFANPISPVAIVSSGNDPILYSLTSGLQDANPIILSRTNGSSKAIRINQNKRFHTNMNDNHEKDILLKSFIAGDRYITLDYAAVLEEWTQHTSSSEHPYFKVSVFVDGNLIPADTETVRASDNDLDSFDAYLSQINVNDNYANLTSNPNTDLRYTSQWRSISLDIGTGNEGRPVEVKLEVRDCNQSVHAGYVYIDNISNCAEEDPCDTCDIDATYTQSVNQCYGSFNGSNLGSGCDAQSYQWTVNGTVVSNQEDVTNNFPNSGTYNVCLTITNNDCNVTDTICKNITVNCEPDCKPASCLNITQVSNCVDYQAWMHCNDPDIDYINWYYTISSSYVHQFAGTSGGNPAGQHAQPIYLPSPPPAIGTWDNYNLYVYAEIVFNDGTVCDEIYTYITLDCSGNGSGGNQRNAEKDLKLYPNPIKSNQELNFDGINQEDIEKIEILDIVGNLKSKFKPTNNEINIRDLTTGIYFVKFYTSKGIKQKKIIIK
jgi:hypothetical protein